MKKLENIPKVVSLEHKNGVYLFKLGKLLHESDISLNQFILDTETEYKVISKYIYGDVVAKIDMNVIAKICFYFQCGIEEVIEFVPKKKLV